MIFFGITLISARAAIKLVKCSTRSQNRQTQSTTKPTALEQMYTVVSLNKTNSQSRLGKINLQLGE